AGSHRLRKVATAGFSSWNNVDPPAAARRFDRGLHYCDGLKSRLSVSQRALARFHRIDECCQLGSQWLLRRRFELMHRTLTRFDFRAARNMSIRESFDLVLGDVVIAHRG